MKLGHLIGHFMRNIFLEELYTKGGETIFKAKVKIEHISRSVL